jgi:alpha-amylase
VLAAITTKNAKLVYTTDGTNPTASSPSVNSGSTITIPVGKTTLKVAMVVDGSITGSIITRTYEVEYVEPFVIPDFCKVAEGEVCAFYETPSSWGNINCYTWTGSTAFDGSWPGKACTQVGTYNGKKIWKWSYSGTKTTQPANIIFNDGSNQTSDLIFKNGGYYNQNGLKGIITGIQVINTTTNGLKRYHTIDGRYAGTDFNALPHGIYVVNGKKVVR